VSQRTLLIAALALIAGGLLFDGFGVVVGDGMGPAEARPGAGMPGRQGAPGGYFPRRPGFAPGERPGGGTWRVIPSPPASPAP
jgi:hypothetical protein